MADVFLNLWNANEVVREMCKKSWKEDPSSSNMANKPKHCSKLKNSTFTIFIHPFDGNSGS